MMNFEDQHLHGNTTWADFDITEDQWLDKVIDKLIEDNVPYATAAHVVFDNESAALSAYHNGLALVHSVNRMKGLLK